MRAIAATDLRFEHGFEHELRVVACTAVYHVTENGWIKVRGDDVTELHFKYYPKPEDHPSAGTPLL